MNGRDDGNQAYHIDAPEPQRGALVMGPCGSCVFKERNPPGMGFPFPVRFADKTGRYYDHVYYLCPECKAAVCNEIAARTNAHIHAIPGTIRPIPPGGIMEGYNCGY